MRTIIMLGLTLIAAAPAAAAPFGDDSFRDAKTGYRVSISHSGSDMLLDGYNPKTLAKFRLTVTVDGVVSGVVAGQKVNYVLPAAAKNARLAAYRAR